MPMLNYRVNPIRVIGSTAFSEASKEELRVLLALIELSGQVESVDELSAAAMTSSARCKSALAFWEESGVISADDQPRIVEEFEERLVRGEIDEVPSKQVADSIRNDNLASMIHECTGMLGQGALSSDDVKRLTALHTQYSLTAEYVITLAASLQNRNVLTIRRLCDDAIRLCSKGCDTLEALEAYLIDMEKTSGVEWEFRRLLGIYNRALSDVERRYFKKWSEEFDYSVGIVSLAYDIAVLNTKNGRGDLRYMDSVLTSWHEAGCRTISECQEKIEADKLKKNAEKATRSGKKSTKSTPETPRYGNFDINEAFASAVARSFKEDDNGDEGGEE